VRQIRCIADERLGSRCVHCGGPMETRDHAPSKVLLDEPYPSHLPVVWSCASCNHGFSRDEAYLACLVECARTHATSSAAIQREKVRQLISTRSELASRVWRVRITKPSRQFLLFTPQALDQALPASPIHAALLERLRWHESQVEGESAEHDALVRETRSVRDVVLKLARGHAMHELSEPVPDVPSSLWFRPIHEMTASERADFEYLPAQDLWPELGSRASLRFEESPMPFVYEWIVVQHEQYRYAAVTFRCGVLVRMVLSEYLACEVLWIG